jgi:hypothetical protein
MATVSLEPGGRGVLCPNSVEVVVKLTEVEVRTSLLKKFE